MFSDSGASEPEDDAAAEEYAVLTDKKEVERDRICGLPRNESGSMNESSSADIGLKLSVRLVSVIGVAGGSEE